MPGTVKKSDPLIPMSASVNYQLEHGSQRLDIETQRDRWKFRLKRLQGIHQA